MNNPRNRLPLYAHFATDLLGVEALLGVDSSLGLNCWSTESLQIMCSTSHCPDGRLLNSLHWMRDEVDEKIVDVELQRFYESKNVRTHRCKLCLNTKCFLAKQQKKKQGIPGVFQFIPDIASAVGQKTKTIRGKTTRVSRPLLQWLQSVP